ncbi:MAG: B12-binding domain-containing radical SAM protein [bacterium]
MATKNNLVLISLNFWKDFPAYGMLCVAAGLRSDREIREKYRLTIKTYGLADDPGLMLGEISSLSPDIIGFSCYLWNISPSLFLGRKLKELLPETMIVLGGPEADYSAARILREHRYIDAIIHGEGEERLAGYLKTLPEGNTEGVSFRQGEEITLNDRPDPIDNLSELPSPYLSVMPPVNKLFPLETLRGCPYHCQYCLIGERFDRVRFFSWERIEAVVKAIKEQGVEYAMIIDPSFFSFPEHAYQVLEILKRYRLPFEVQLNPQTLTRKQIDALFSSGLKIANLGIQTVSPQALKTCRRSWNLKTVADNVNLLGKPKQANISMDLMYGLPETGLRDFWDSIDFAFGFDFNLTVYLYHFSVLPGTDFFNSSGRYGLEFDPDPPYKIYAHSRCGRREMELNRAYASLLTAFCTTTVLKDIVKMFMKLLKMKASVLTKELFPPEADLLSLEIENKPFRDQLEIFLERLYERFGKELDSKYREFARESFLVSRIMTGLARQRIYRPEPADLKDYVNQGFILPPGSVFQALSYNIPDHFNGIKPELVARRPTEYFFFMTDHPQLLPVSASLKKLLLLFQEGAVFNQAYQELKHRENQPVTRQQFYASIKRLEMIGALRPIF